MSTTRGVLMDKAISLNFDWIHRSNKDELIEK
jgi:hypothetical protein